MSITINAHQLGLLIDKTIAHIGDETIKPLHGIRLDADGRYLYTVASDRYTLAAARYQLNHGDTAQEPWACTIPGTSLTALREWIRGHKGAVDIAIEPRKDAVAFDSTQASFSIAVDRGLEFPDWRGILRTLTEHAADETPFPAFDSTKLAKFGSAEGYFRLRVTTDEAAALLIAEDFIGAVMPARFSGLGPISVETFDKARDLWQWTLAAGGKGIDMETSMPEAEPPAYEAPKTVREAGGGLLQEVLNSTDDLHAADYHADRDLWDANIRIGCAAWIAYRYLDALNQADPRLARQTVADVAEQLDSGEIGEWAWDAAESAGFDPQQWQNEHTEAVTALRQKRAPEWAERLAMGLNVAKNAGIGFRVDDNPHVVYDEQAEQWTAVKPETAKV
ncbi:hypothetical protein [Streptomyces nymphaeiformis]|uniref:DNA polymerase III beta sliding clamp central domain-containing protein n=1 Tax=Streptomyces nymphaeiformis TaxID=2663842 RepID=A0A7W7XF99_9ACTN|nr:hypothetical protein [Streptomyces nymphaeiformis]MBB4984963.1 hypothetical protein [Streptomyces nymphaeiformis]